MTLATDIKRLAAEVSPEVLRSAINELSTQETDALLHDWDLWARPEQLVPPGNWQVWAIIAGRGFGKTRTGAETVKRWVKKYPLVNLIGATADDARDIMIEGESGILSCCSNAERPRYIKSARCLDWPNGAKSLIFTADEPERLRGKQHMKLWPDEVASWRYRESYDQAMFGLRLGDNPQAVITTTPRPTALIKEILKDPATFITRGTTYDNRANLAPQFYDRIIKSYEGTRLGRQELNAELLDDNPGALWNRANIDLSRARFAPLNQVRVVVAIDPAVTSNPHSDETGIIVACLGDDGDAYILDDLSLIASPDEWARLAVQAYWRYKCDRLVAETNNGGDLVESVIRTVDKNISYKKLHASRGKAIRAEPIAALYEQGRIHHIGFFAKLEDQMCEFDPANLPPGSPDRVDALVWCLTELFESSGSAFIGV